jgi:cystathionine gamma-synthase
MTPDPRKTGAQPPSQAPPEEGRPLSLETLAVMAGRGPRVPDEPLSAPVVFAGTYHAGGPVGYGRDGNPTWTALEETIGALEGGRALAFASGMGAITAVFESLPPGARIVVPGSSYIGTRAFLAERGGRGRFEARIVDVTDTEATLAACEGAALLWIETPTNPLIGIADLAALCPGARRAGARVAVDNTFATPLRQRPLDLGADIVVHSVTKYLSGHSDLQLGAAVTRDEALLKDLFERRELYGAIPGPMEAFLALRGIRTLPVRLARAEESAGELARRLGRHPAVTRVRYPGLPGDPGHAVASRQMTGFGAMLSFEVKGGAEAAEAVCVAVRVLTHATSLGGVETLIERRHKWRGEESTPPSLLRMSVGCENVEDLWADLVRALAGSSGTTR